MSAKQLRVIYYITTFVFVGFLIVSSLSYLFHQPTIAGIAALGFPDFFRWQLAILKLAAAVMLSFPKVKMSFKEWAYAGSGFFLITASVAHFAHADSLAIQLVLILLFLKLIISRWTLAGIYDGNKNSGNNEQ